MIKEVRNYMHASLNQITAFSIIKVLECLARKKYKLVEMSRNETN